MDKLHWFYGFLLGIAGAAIGSYIYITLIAKYDFSEGIDALRSTDMLGKVIKLGAILNLVIFFLLLRFKKDNMAKGVILATAVLGICAFFI